MKSAVTWPTYATTFVTLSLIPVEGMKVVEIEKCRSDIKKLREEIATKNNRWRGHNTDSYQQDQ